MHELQQRYAALKAAKSAASAQVDAALRPFDYLLDTDEGANQYEQIALAAESAHGLGILSHQLLEAENQLLDWLKATMLNTQPEYTELITDIIDKGRTHVKHRDRLLALAAKFMTE